jgi:hypothetical protein
VTVERATESAVRLRILSAFCIRMSVRTLALHSGKRVLGIGTSAEGYGEPDRFRCKPDPYFLSGTLTLSRTELPGLAGSFRVRVDGLELGTLDLDREGARIGAESLFFYPH